MDSRGSRCTLEIRKVGTFPFRRKVVIFKEYDDTGKVIYENIGYKRDFQKQYGMEKEDVFFPIVYWGLVIVAVLIVQTMIWG